MLTVKCIRVTGHEDVYPATRASYQPSLEDGKPLPPNCASTKATAPCVFIDTPKGDTFMAADAGSVYVMNDAGKTVAKYELGGWPGLDAGSLPMASVETLRAEQRQRGNYI